MLWAAFKNAKNGKVIVSVPLLDCIEDGVSILEQVRAIWYGLVPIGLRIRGEE